MNIHSSARKAVFASLAVWIVFLTGFTVLGARLPVKIYTSADGLGSGFVDYIYRDSRGFMWFCTRDGLSRFDGSRFVTYAIGDTNSPPGIENIYETRDGVYWISTTGGTYRFDPNRTSQPEGDRPRLDAEFVTNSRGMFLQDRNGVLWLASSSLFRLADLDGKQVFVPVPLDIPARSNATFAAFELAEASDGSLWIQSSLGLIRRLPDSRIVFYPHDYSVTGGETAIIADRSGRIWLSFGNKIFVLKPESIESLPSSETLIIKQLTPTRSIETDPANQIPMPREGGQIYELGHERYIDPWPAKRLMQTSDGSVWVGGDGFLIHFNEGRMRVMSSAEGLPTMIGRIGEDSAGNIWIGGQAGLARLNRGGLESFDHSDGLPSSRFFSAIEDEAGRLYFGLSKFEIAMFDGNRFSTVKPKLSQNLRRLWTSRYLFRSSSGDFWILTNEGAYRFSGVNSFSQLDGMAPTAVYNASNGLNGNSAFQIFEDSSGDIWLSTRGVSPSMQGLARLRNGESQFQIIDEKVGFPPEKSPSSFVEDRYGNLWFGFYEGGLARFDGERFRVVTKEEGVPESGVITDLLSDSKGRIWLASSNFGLYRIDDVSSPEIKLINITLKDGLNSSNIRSLVEDRFGRIYAGTARGIDRISPETMSIKHYSVTDGLAADFVSDSHRDQNGDLWFLTNNGVSRLRPTPDERSAQTPVFIDNFRVSGILQPIALLGEQNVQRGQLSHTDNNIQISFFALDFRAGENIRFQYKLDPVDQDWGVPSEATTITFANLETGTYTFSVRAMDSEGTVSENPAMVSFTILPPIWQRWWFMLGMFTLLALSAYFVYRYRTAKLRQVNRALTEAKLAEERLRLAREERLYELEQVRARIATDLHDDIGASLTQIAILSEVARAQAGTSNGGASEPLAKITDVSNQLVGTMSDIVWSINPSKDHLSDLSQRMRRFAADILSSKDIEFKLDSPPTGHEIVLNSNVRREVFLIFKEAVNNIAKHSGASSVSARLAINSDGLEFTISDNGRGFDVETDVRDVEGNGIASMMRRAKALDGSIKFDSSPGKGTTIIVNFPLVERTFA